MNCVVWCELCGIGSGLTGNPPVQLSSYFVEPDDANIKLNWPDSSAWVNSASSRPTYDSDERSWIFDDYSIAVF